MTVGSYRAVAVALDGSDRALEALGPAQRLARLHRAELWLVTVDDGPDPAEERFDRARLPGRDPARTVVLDASGDVAETLGRFDDDHPDVLLCLTTRGRRPLAKALFGHVAAAVVGHTSQAVVLVGPACHGEHDIPVNRLVVALDGGPEAEATLPWATAWSAAADLTIGLVHIVYPRPDPAAGIVPDQSTLAESRYIGSVANRLVREGHRAVVLGGEHAHPPTGVLAVASDPGSLLFLAASNRPPAAQVVLGSTSAELLRTAPVPVVLLSRPS